MLFEYYMLVQTKPRKDATEFDAEFDAKHPKSHTLIQKLAPDLSHVMTIRFNGQLSQFEADENRINGGHPPTTTIQNDLAKILLGFFVP